MANVRLWIVAGPPCSGKSTLGTRIASLLHIKHLQMDAIRETHFPGSMQTPEHRAAAYRLMHAAAEEDLREGRSVVLDATYSAEQWRDDVSAIASRLHLPIALLQCVANPNESVKRFLKRGPGHPAVDLTATKVLVENETYPYSPVGTTVGSAIRADDPRLATNTTVLGIDDVVDLVQRAPEQLETDPTGEDVRAWREIGAPLSSSSPKLEKAELLNEFSRHDARYRLLLTQGLIWIAFGCVAIGLIPASNIIARGLPELVPCAIVLALCVRCFYDRGRTIDLVEGALILGALGWGALLFAPTSGILMTQIAKNALPLVFFAAALALLLLRLRLKQGGARPLDVITLLLGLLLLLAFVFLAVAAMRGLGVPLPTGASWEGWSSLWFTAALLLGLGPPLVEFAGKMEATYRPIADAGLVPRFEPYEDDRPSDRVLCKRYGHRLVDPNRMLSGLPIYFLIPPESGKRFDVLIESGGASFDEGAMRDRASRVGLDWDEFTHWRWETQRRKYRTDEDRAGIRCTTITSDRDAYVLKSCPVSYRTFQCTDMAVNIDGPLLPNMRALFEPEAWQRTWETGETLDLSSLDFRDSANYSLMVSTSALVTFNDTYVLLSRRSRHISAGTGGVNPTSGGGAQWRKDFLKTRKRVGEKSSLVWAALRELHEETGLKIEDLTSVSEPCFIGAGFNLLHGRDLNFYAHFRATLGLSEINDRRMTARDRWESSHFLIVRLDKVDAAGRLVDDLAFLNRNLTRHARAALHCLKIVNHDT